MIRENAKYPVPVALINDSITPYRLNLHSRMAREMAGFQFWSLFTHEVSNSPWRLNVPSDIRPVFFGPGEQSLRSHALLAQYHEWAKAGAILRWMKHQQIQAVVLGGYSDVGRLRILWQCWRRRLPCLLFGDSNIHCDNASGWRRRLKKILLPFVLSHCSGILCCGRFGEKYFLRYGVPAERIFRFPYEPDYDQIRNARIETIAAVRQAHHLGPERKYLIYSGRLVALKRVDLLIVAFSRIAPARPDWDLIVAGDGGEQVALKSLVTADISRRVIWTGFINAPEKLAALYNIADILVLPSDYEPWGVVVTEGAVRMPVVASSVCGAAADVIIDGANGRIFETGDLESLAGCLLDATDPARLAAMTAAAPAQFAKWHEDSDPIKGLRAALSAIESL